MHKLSLQNIGFRYAASGVSEISFSAAGGEILAIVGASGSGKSTILNLIAGFIQPDKGVIKFDDELVASQKFLLPPKKRSIGLVFQNHALLPHMNVWDNVLFGASRETSSTQIEQILRELRIESLAKNFPHEISGGESQRVSLARAMASNAHIVLMDEPFSSIDSVFRRELREDMTRFLKRKDRITIIVTHDAEEALELADQIVVLDKGQILQKGTPQDIYFSPHHIQTAKLFGEMNHIQDPELIKKLTGMQKDEVFLRPELLSLSQEGAVAGQIIHIAYRGGYDMASVVIKGQRCLKISAPSGQFHVGQKVHIQYEGMNEP